MYRQLALRGNTFTQHTGYVTFLVYEAEYLF